MHQIVCRLGFAPDPLGKLTSLPQTPSWFRGGAHGEREGGRGGERREGRGGRGRDGKTEEGVPECPNPELASLFSIQALSCHIRPGN